MSETKETNNWEKDFNKFITKIHQESGRSQTFISTKHYIEIVGYIDKLLDSQRKELLEEVEKVSPIKMLSNESISEFSQGYSKGWNDSILDFKLKLKEVNK